MADWDTNATQSEDEKTFSHLTYAPFDPSVDSYLFSRIDGMGKDSMVPLEYSGWRDEQLSWKESCYLHAGLNPAPTLRITGPDAIRFFSENCVNSFADFPVGALKHAVMCNDAGLVMQHGTVFRMGEDDFLTYFLAPFAAYKLYSGGYDAKGDWVGDQFLLQLGGPRALEVLEAASADCIHDVDFLRHRPCAIAGKDVRIARLGMAGSLAYEVHGSVQDLTAVYEAIMAAGAEFGIKKLGLKAYQMNHTEDGFPQSFVHFPVAWAEDAGFLQFLNIPVEYGRFLWTMRGSMVADIEARYRNPVELGWAHLIDLGHEFTGRGALEAEVADPRRQMVTLVWDAEDVVDVYASQYREGEPYMPMEPIHLGQAGGNLVLYADQVSQDGKPVGISSGRTYSAWYRQMISLCSIDSKQAEPGTRVSVLWGDPGTRQKEIGATVSRFPYLDVGRNEDVDVSEIACRLKK
jgi:glycine cleavage system aminomethyltransferase T